MDLKPLAVLTKGSSDPQAKGRSPSTMIVERLVKSQLLGGHELSDGQQHHCNVLGGCENLRSRIAGLFYQRVCAHLTHSAGTCGESRRPVIHDFKASGGGGPRWGPPRTRYSRKEALKQTLWGPEVLLEA